MNNILKGQLPLLVFIMILGTLAQAAPPSGQFIAKCFGCHGRTGVSGYGEFPNLAGLDHNYIWSQLKSFRDGKRNDYTMNAMPFMVSGLSDDDLYGLAEVFARLPSDRPTRSEMSQTDLNLFEEGKKIINGNTVTCRFCHLGNATGNGPGVAIYPDLVGQQKAYLINQIKAFREKKRWNPIMNADLIGGMSDYEVEAVATYFRYLKAK